MDDAASWTYVRFLGALKCNDRMAGTQRRCALGVMDRYPTPPHQRGSHHAHSTNDPTNQPDTPPFGCFLPQVAAPTGGVVTVYLGDSVPSGLASDVSVTCTVDQSSRPAWAH